MSISKREIIEQIPINYFCYSIKSINNKGLLLVGGKDQNNDIFNIYVYRSDNYELIQTIENAHKYYTRGFLEINNHLIYSYSYDGIKNWLF